jgi:hypothetical protein
MAQKAMGSRIQFNPAPAIWAKSSSVCTQHHFRTPSVTATSACTGLAHDECLIMLLQVTKRTICTHQLGERVLVDRRNRCREIFLEECRGDEGLEDEPTPQVDPAKIG